MSAKTKVEAARKSAKVANEMLAEVEKEVKRAFLEGHSAGASRVVGNMNADEANAEYDWRRSHARGRMKNALARRKRP